MTSNYARLKRIPSGMVPVSISIKPPYCYGKARRHYPALCPTVAMLAMAPAEYNALYDEILSRLDPRKTFDELGENAVLLCYESPNVSCHRRRVAEFFEQALGVVIPELGFDRSDSLRYLEMPQRLSRKPQTQWTSGRKAAAGTSGELSDALRYEQAIDEWRCRGCPDAGHPTALELREATVKRLRELPVIGIEVLKR